MYIPKIYNEADLVKLHALIRARPLATVTTLTDQGLTAHHIPFYLADNGAQGILRAHVNRNNPIWQDFKPDVAVVAVFHDVDAYISPSWYASKVENGKVVPTWNYAAVHAHGKMRVVDDAAWIRAQIDALTAQQEGVFDQPWMIDDAPIDYINPMIARALMGIEIVIERLEGQWKVSQDKPERNQASVIAALQSTDGRGHKEMAHLIRERQKNRSEK